MPVFAILPRCGLGGCLQKIGVPASGIRNTQERRVELLIAPRDRRIASLQETSIVAVHVALGTILRLCVLKRSYQTYYWYQ